jgi:hypothetical protein
MKRVLLNIPQLDGHRQVYCGVLCDYFLSRGFSVTVATDLDGVNEYAPMKTLGEHPNIRFIPDTWTFGVPRSSVQLRRLVAAAREAAADLTFLAEADLAQGLLCAQITRPRYRLPGRRVGLFIRSTNYVHEVKRPQTGRIGRVIERAVLDVYAYRPLSLAQPRLFHEVATRRLDVLDAALCLDEVFVAEHGGRYRWLPDIAVGSSAGAEVSTETAEWEAEVSAFLSAQGNRAVVVYEGMPQARRGYEELLQLACDVDGCFLHSGKLHDSHGYPHRELGPRATLISRSAIVESGRFYQDFETARVTLRAARCVVLPYLRHIGSSGVMLQALMAGRPVLVPDQGLMAWRVRNFGLGLTFTPGDSRDMRYKFSVLCNLPSEFFADSIRHFLAYFDRAHLNSALDVSIGLSGVEPPIPTSETDVPSRSIRMRP